MNLKNLRTKIICLLCFFTGATIIGCKKLIAINEPVTSITTTETFSNDASATSAMAGVYTVMINTASVNSFSAGLTTYLAGASSDELYFQNGANNSFYIYSTNHLSASNSSTSTPLGNIWTSAYSAIYGANSVIEGIAASTSGALHDSVRVELTGEAKFVRAFSYFYLTNFFGDVPMALTIDFNKTQNLSRTPQQQVYQQIIQDLKDAQSSLAVDYSVGHGERIIPNKWAATLLLARTYLYIGDYADAAAQANTIINNNALFSLESDLKNVFSTTSREAVWQLKPSAAFLSNAIPEGVTLLPNPLSTGTGIYCLDDQLLSAFEVGDQRKVDWVDSTNNTDNGGGVPQPPLTTYYPYKYIIGLNNSDPNQPPPQYYMVLRFAEAYLIRAEAEANGATGGDDAAISNLNVIRTRAGLPNLTAGVNVKAAVAQENRIEFFAEWGHRWFDLKRTGQAHNVLSIIPLKQPWAGDYQFLYPIPQSEITQDHFLTQNNGY